MELFILRHGHAQSQAETDDARPLSPEGKEEIISNLTRNLEEMRGLELALVSPFLRTQQTFEVARDYLPTIKSQRSSMLVPSGNIYSVIDELNELNQTGINSVILVSHMPLVATLIDALCGAEPGRYRMATGSLAALDVDTPALASATLRWLRHPGP